MRRRQADLEGIAAFQPARAAGLSLPGVESGTRYDGAPVLRAGGRFMACLALHSSAEPGTLVVKFDAERREQLLEEAPDTYYLTEHYRPYPVVLVRLTRIAPDALRDLLSESRRATLARHTDLDGEAAPGRRCARTVHTELRRGRR